MGVFQDWLDYMTRNPPAEGWRGDEYLILWPADRVPALNAAYKVDTYAPGRAIFASNGFDAAFAFDGRSQPHRIVRFEFVGMGDRTQEDEAATFAEFILGFAPGHRRDLGVPPDHEVSHIQPIILGGPPNDRRNMQVLDRETHSQAVNFWNNILVTGSHPAR